MVNLELVVHLGQYLNIFSILYTTLQPSNVIFLFLVTLFPFSVDLKPFTIIGKCVAKANFHY